MKKNFISLAIKSLTPEKIEYLALKSGFQVRKPKKIAPLALLNLYCQESINTTPSFNDISGVFGDLTGNAPSRQGVGKRINEKFVNFLKMVLEEVLGDKAWESDDAKETNLCFPRIVVQDSTIIKLPLHLFDDFSGVSNQHSSVCNARIQGVYDLIAKRFLFFSIDKYSKNDPLAAPELEILKDDLILRDRGYLTCAEIRRMQENQTFYIFRHNSTMIYRDPKTDKEIDLMKLLKKNGHIDMNVCLNDKNRTHVRIVTAPVDEETANLRRMKEKKKVKRCQTSEKLLFLMSWTIFITNLPCSKFSFKDIFTLYGLRWRIENIFKTWKSHMSFALIHRVSIHQLKAMLMARFITIMITMHCIYKRCERVLSANSKKQLSMTKLMRYIQVKNERLQEIQSSVLLTVRSV